MKRLLTVALLLTAVGCGRSATETHACAKIDEVINDTAFRVGTELGVAGWLDYGLAVKSTRVELAGTSGDVRAGIVGLAAAYRRASHGHAGGVPTAIVGVRQACGLPLNP